MQSKFWNYVVVLMGLLFAVLCYTRYEVAQLTQHAREQLAVVQAKIDAAQPKELRLRSVQPEIMPGQDSAVVDAVDSTHTDTTNDDTTLKQNTEVKSNMKIIVFTYPTLEEGSTSNTAGYNNPKFKIKPTITRDIAELRKLEYSTEYMDPLILVHEGGSYLDGLQMRQTVYAVVNSMPNVPHINEVYDLIYETAVVETNLGSVPYTYAAENWNNFGIAQIRHDTAEYLLSWLKKVRPDAYNSVMTYYILDMSLEDNLLVNVPFSLAIAAQYYWHRVKDLEVNIRTLEDRAKVWKSFYNSPSGVGTVNGYINRVKKFYEVRTINNENQSLAVVIS